jgi:hypothetical protein
MEEVVGNIIFSMAKGNIADETEDSVSTCSQDEHWSSRY